MYLASRRPDLAKEVLLDGLASLASLAADPNYLRASLSFLLEFQEDAKLTEITDQLLAGPANPATRPILANFAATAAYYRGHYDKAEGLLASHHLGGSVDGAILQARIAWGRDFPELALLQLKSYLALHPDCDEARVLLAGYYHSLGRTSEWESTLVERVAADPLAPAPRVAYLQLHHQRGDHARLELEASRFLQQFAREPAALLALANFAANTGQPALARRVQQILAPRSESSGTAALMVAEAHLVAGEYQPGLDLITRCTRDYPEWAGQFAPALNSLQAVALCGLGRMDEARLSLDLLLTQGNLRTENLVAVADRLSKLGARELARSALDRAVRADPLNQAALARLLRLELEAGETDRLAVHLPGYLRTRQPSREILARARAALGSDRHLLLPAQQELLASLQAALGRRAP